MTDTALILQNRLQDIHLSLERAHLLQCDENWKSGGSVPPYSSIGLILRGHGTMSADHTQIHPAPGQLYLLPAMTNQIFSTDPEDPYEKYYCHFNIACPDRELFEFIRLPLCVDAIEIHAARSLFEQMSAACARADLFSSLRAKQLMLQLLLYYLECCPAGSITAVRTKEDAPLDKALAFVEENLHRPITVSELAEIAGYHPSYFTKLFQRRMGLPPVQFITRRKTERAVELLTTSSLPVSDVSQALGFGNPYYFSNFFKKQTGMTPSQYRAVYTRSHP